MTNSFASRHNDKSGQSTERSEGSFSLQNDALDYTIRFQNSGNDTAFAVVVRDTLAASLDPNTLQLLGASHPVRTDIKGQVVTFTFTPIALDFERNNNAASQGFVAFRIKARPNLTPPTIVNNTASIYFDFNPAIQTNTTENVLVSYLATENTAVKPLNLRLSPNPTRDFVVFNWDNNFENKQYDLLICDASGKILQRLQTNNTNYRYSATHLPQGNYTVFINDKQGHFWSGRLTKMD